MSRETVGMIFEAAVKVFAERGFDRAKMDDIAREAGVAKGTIYYHFTSKDELFTALMNHGLQKMKEYVRRRMDEVKQPTLKLRGLLEAEVSYLFQHGTFAKLLLAEVWSSNERQYEFRAHIHELESIIREVLEVGIQEGDFREINATETSIAIFGAMSVTVLQEVFRDIHLSGEELANTRTTPVVDMLEMLLHQGILKN
ncbi:TetR/AcrR family transcriptional regulator [Marininema halotolerans]|uniref:DNA-binding transcriptional regulator, AcrR family n=1 Tax=Marininema halotolerans TaxID=1155944 RepID=A0A1I6PCS9_9BACL|nr:TetR/AcrR family transcriptional regulator [Marininema halotolerans]SFS38017.1 DNA-binding transcriptional regulator, AcrR family [Marininema halotolerans]